MTVQKFMSVIYDLFHYAIIAHSAKVDGRISGKIISGK
jgi:hypothetical protein